MMRLSFIILALATFARDGWSSGPHRPAPVSLRDLADLAIVHVLVILAIGLGMCGLAAGSAILLKWVL